MSLRISRNKVADIVESYWMLFFGLQLPTGLVFALMSFCCPFILDLPISLPPGLPDCFPVVPRLGSGRLMVKIYRDLSPPAAKIRPGIFFFCGSDGASVYERAPAAVVSLGLWTPPLEVQRGG